MIYQPNMPRISTGGGLYSGNPEEQAAAEAERGRKVAERWGNLPRKVRVVETRKQREEREAKERLGVVQVERQRCFACQAWKTRGEFQPSRWRSDNGQICKKCLSAHRRRVTRERFQDATERHCKKCRTVKARGEWSPSHFLSFGGYCKPCQAQSAARRRRQQGAKPRTTVIHPGTDIILARIAGGCTTQAVSEEFGVALRVAQRWFRDARKEQQQVEPLAITFEN